MVYLTKKLRFFPKFFFKMYRLALHFTPIFPFTIYYGTIRKIIHSNCVFSALSLSLRYPPPLPYHNVEESIVYQIEMSPRQGCLFLFSNLVQHLLGYPLDEHIILSSLVPMIALLPCVL